MTRIWTWSLLLIAACGGGSGNQPPDAFGTSGSGDGPGSDASSDGAPPGMVVVHVRSADDGTPEANIRVLFANADGTLAADALTDATGTAVAPLATGHVTVFHGSNSSSSAFDLLTIEGVVAGDVLELGPTPEPAKTGSTTVNVDLAGVDTASVTTPCSRSLNPEPVAAQPIDTFADPRCSTNVGVLATFFKNGVVGFSHLANQTIAANAPITMPARVAPLHTALTLAAMPANVRERFGVIASVDTDAGRFEDFQNLTFVPPADFTATFVRPPVGNTLLFGGRFERTDGRFGEQQVQVGAPAAAAVTLPVAGLLQRWLTGAFAVAEAGVQWFADGTPDHATIAWTTTVYAGGAPDGSFRSVHWTVLGPAPPAATSGVVPYPRLPDPNFAIRGSDTISKVAFRLIGLDGTATYADVHATLGADMSTILAFEPFGVVSIDDLHSLFEHAGVTGVKLTVTP
jgi:hypothetical protein